MSKVVKGLVDIIEVLPDKVANTSVLRDGFISPFWGLIVRSSAFNNGVVDKELGDFKDFWLENEGDITTEDSNCIGMTLGKGSIVFCAKQGLESGETA